MSPQLAALTLYLRLVNKPLLARETNLQRLRDSFAAKARLIFRAPKIAEFRKIDGIQWCGPREGAGAILYLHGGGFVMGAPATHRHLAARLALAAGVPAMVAAYRLAPDHPHPAQIEDALAAYARAAALGPVAVAGDSAGGGLAFALVGAARAAGLPDPACVTGFSPWCDMTGASPTLATNARSDAMLPATRVAEVAAMRMAGGDPRDPLASPVFARFDRPPPPALVFASRAEILAGDAEAIVAAWRAAGAAAELVWEDGAPHAWPIFAGLAPEADRAIARAGDFIKAHLGKRDA